MNESAIFLTIDPQALAKRQANQKVANILDDFLNKSKRRRSEIYFIADFDLSEDISKVIEQVGALAKFNQEYNLPIITPFDALENRGIGIGFSQFLTDLNQFSEPAANNILRMYEVYQELLKCHINGDLAERSEQIKGQIDNLEANFDDNEIMNEYYQHLQDSKENLSEQDLSEYFGDWSTQKQLNNPNQLQLMMGYARLNISSAKKFTVISSNDDLDLAWCHLAEKKLQISEEPRIKLHTILGQLTQENSAEAKTFLSALLNYQRHPTQKSVLALHAASLDALCSDDDDIVELGLIAAQTLADNNEDANVMLILDALDKHKERFKNVPVLNSAFNQLIQDFREQAKTNATKIENEARAVLEFLNNPTSGEKQKNLVTQARKAKGHTNKLMRKIGIGMLVVGILVVAAAAFTIAAPALIGSSAAFLLAAKVGAEAALATGSVSGLIGGGLFATSRRKGVAKEMRDIKSNVIQEITASP